MKNKTNIKKRNWAFVIYPTKKQLEELNSKYDGSDGYGLLPDNWREMLNISGLQYAVSPLHDKDQLEDGSGKLKKPHYHVIVVFGSPTTFNNVLNLTKQFNAPAPVPLEQIRGYYRYLTHKDNADKYQYDEKEIITGNKFNISDFIEMSKSEVNEIKRQLQIFILENDIYEYSDFMNELLAEDKKLEYDVAASNTIFFDRYIASKRNKLKDNVDYLKRDKYALIDKETGEVIDLSENKEN